MAAVENGSDPAAEGAIIETTEKSKAQINDEFQIRMDLVPTLTSCVCGWTHFGTAKEGREAALLHRKQEHPELVARPRKRRPPNPARISGREMNEEEREVVDQERFRRARLLGIDLE